MNLLSRPSTGQSTAAEERHPAPVLISALWIGVVAAVSLVLGAVLPVVSGASPGFASAPLLITLAVVPMGVAVGFTLTGRYTVAAGVLIGLAALAPGRLLLDLQLAVDASLATRPELYLPSTLGSPGMGTGLVFLLAGHLLTAVAGLLAAGFMRAEAEAAGRSQPGRRRWQVITPLIGIIAGISLLMTPLRSGTPYLLAGPAFEGPFPASGGYLLLAVAIPLAGLLVTGSVVDGIAKGALLGLALGTFAVALPELISALSVSMLSAAAGPVVALIAGLALLGVSFLPFSEVSPAEDLARQDVAGEARLPGLFWLRLTTGILGLATAVAAVVGALSSQLTSPSALSAPKSPASWLLLVAGVVVGVLAPLTIAPPVSPVIRPALSVVWVGVLPAGTAVLGTAVVATDVRGFYSEGPGTFWTIVAVALAGVTAACSVITGVVERDEAEEAGPDAPRPTSKVVAVLAAAAVLTVAAFGTPTFTAPDYVAPGLWTNFSDQSWGLLAAVLTVLGAIALVPRSRPSSAASLLLGATLVLALRAAELPMLGGQVEGAQAGTGFWLSLGCAGALLIAAVMAVAGARKLR
jgi:hypothetical protein